MKDSQRRFNRVVIWSPRLHTHTSSYVWKGYYDAFEHLGYETHWMDDNTDLTGHDLAGSLFLVQGDHDKRVPIREDCDYILHNVDQERYQDIKPDRKICLQVYTKDVDAREVEKVDVLAFWEPSTRTLYQPWATDLLPHQFQTPNPRLVREPVVYWAGSITEGPHGNVNEMRAFLGGGQHAGIKVAHIVGAGMEKARHLIQKSAFGLALQGEWQVTQCYVPCRVFKVASVGRIPLTNSEFVHNLLDRRTIYFPDCSRLVNEGIAWEKHFEKKHLVDLQELVKTKHTYLNRVQSLLDVL